MNRFTLTVLAAVVAAAACGGSSTFELGGGDNRPELLRAAFELADAPKAGSPRNAAGKNVVYVVSGSKSKTSLTAFDLGAKSQLWSVDTTKRDIRKKVLDARLRSSTMIESFSENPRIEALVFLSSKSDLMLEHQVLID